MKLLYALRISKMPFVTSVDFYIDNLIATICVLAGSALFKQSTWHLYFYLLFITINEK